MEAVVAILVFCAMVSSTVASDPDTVQDICVADLASGIKMNGYLCKANVTAEDFFSNAIAKPGNTDNTMGSVVTGANVMKIPGLNTQGVSISRIDYAPNGVNPPHTHPRASEAVYVLFGELEVGFLTTTNQLISKVIKEGDIFVFPRALIHYQRNLGNEPASVLAAFNSQNPGTQSLVATLFNSTPPLPEILLTTTFQTGHKEIEKMKSKLAPKN